MVVREKAAGAATSKICLNGNDEKGYMTIMIILIQFVAVDFAQLREFLAPRRKVVSLRWSVATGKFSAATAATKRIAPMQSATPGPGGSSAEIKG